MWRMTVFALLLCAGCASPGDTLLEDGLWGDVRAMFSRGDSPYTPAVAYQQRATASKTAAAPSDKQD
jgi:hypothetical protein